MPTSRPKFPRKRIQLVARKWEEINFELQEFLDSLAEGNATTAAEMGDMITIIQNGSMFDPVKDPFLLAIS